MEENKEIITRFYTAFQQRDAAAMNNCYSEDIVFSDPVFMLLEGDQVRAMWQMLCENAKEFSLTFNNIQLIDHEYATCSWTANYIFSKTGNRVQNNVKAFMRLKDGKIIEHSDAFRLSTWMGQALGIPGKLFGWTGFMKRKVQLSAKKSLLGYMEKNMPGSI